MQVEDSVTWEETLFTSVMVRQRVLGLGLMKGAGSIGHSEFHKLWQGHYDKSPAECSSHLMNNNGQNRQFPAN